MSLTIKYLDTPEGAQTSAIVTGVGLQPFSAATSAENGADDVAWATTEPGLWLLDGSRDIMSDDPQNVGWWSDTLSDESGYFRIPPVLVIDFDSRFSATGITITFSASTEQWCSRVIVRWYRDGEMLAEIEGFPDSPKWAGGGSVDSFDRITIDLLETNTPESLAKIQQITIGQLIVFGREEIISAQLVNEVDHTLGTMPVDISRFEVFAPDGLSLNPQQNQRVELYRDSQLLATHYIENGTRSAAGHYVLDCHSAVGRLESDFLGSVYDGVPAEDLLPELLDYLPVYIDPKLRRREVTGYIPVCTRREALQQVCFAIGAMVSTSKSDVINIIPIPDTGDVKFADDDIFAGAEIEIAKRVAAVEVAAHRYKKSNTVETLLDDEVISGEDVLITFDAPHWGYEISGGTITGEGANWITITADGAVAVTAKIYTHTTTIRKKKNPDATYAERGNVVSVTEATLVNSSNVQQVLDRLLAASERRWTLTQDVVVTDQEIGSIVTSHSPWGGTVTGIITSIDSTITQNGHTARVVISGKEAT